MKIIKNINDIFLQKILKNSNVPVLIDFWAEWCNPCKLLAEIITEIEKLYKFRIKTVKLNIDYNQYSVKKFSIKTVPTIIIAKNKTILKRKNGVITKKYLIKTLNKILLYEEL